MGEERKGGNKMIAQDIPYGVDKAIDEAREREHERKMRKLRLRIVMLDIIMVGAPTVLALVVGLIIGISL
jgi:hypothetical protein